MPTAAVSESALASVTVGVGALSIDDVVRVARFGAPVELGEDAVAAITETRAAVDKMAAGDVPVYGVSTGFGALASKPIPREMRAQLQRSLVRSHAAGAGDEIDREIIRGLMLSRLNNLATGRTGVRLSTAQAYAALLNAGITPVVYEWGSLGCSGDLAPLAHVALALIGEGEVRNAEGVRQPSLQALEAAGLEPVELVEKEGLALINGTDGMLGMLCLALHDLDELVKYADLGLSLTLQAIEGSVVPFDDTLVGMRPQYGQQASAANIRALTDDSALVSRPGSKFPRVQDAYSIRCHPQVAGAVRSTMAHARDVANAELASAIDNPVVTADGTVASNGNFHGAPVAYVLDFLSIAVADLASISERRTDRLLDANRSQGLPPFLAGDAGVDSGGMIGQYTAAGIVSELKRLAVPATVDSIPSSAMQEDHVSMGWSAAMKLRRAIRGLRTVLSIEVLFAARGIDFRDAEPSPAAKVVIETIRGTVAGPGSDRFLSPEIRSVVEMSSALVASAEDVTGTLA